MKKNAIKISDVLIETEALNELEQVKVTTDPAHPFEPADRWTDLQRGQWRMSDDSLIMITRMNPAYLDTLITTIKQTDLMGRFKEETLEILYNERMRRLEQKQ